MPCDAIRRLSVNLENVKNPALLEKALQGSQGFANVQRNEQTGLVRAWHKETGQFVTIGGGRVQLNRGTEHVADVIKQAYTTTVIKTAAQKFGWRVETNKNDPAKLRVTR